MAWNSSKDSARRPAPKMSKPWIGVLVGVVLLILSGIGYYLTQVKEEEAPDFQKGVYQQFNHITAWLTDSRHRIEEVKQQLDKVKHLGQQADAEQAVHFEFYSTLPAMKVAGQDEVDLKSKLENKPIITGSVAEKSAIRRPVFLNPKALEEDFAQVLPKQGYVLQLATFSQLNRAESYRSGLNDYQVEIIKAYVGQRHLYRVQVGPFSSRDEVIATEKVLKKKGYAGIVRKIQMG